MTLPTMAALGGLLPAAGAIALVVRAVGQRRRTGAAAPSPRRREPVTMPIELPSARPARAAPPTGTCESCGTEIAGREKVCAMCRREAEAGEPSAVRTTLLHWALFIALMTLVIGAGWLAANG